MFLIAFDSIFGSVRLARSPASADPADARPGAAPPPRRVWVEAVSLYLGRSQKGRGKLDFASQPWHWNVGPEPTGTPPNYPKHQAEHLQTTRNSTEHRGIPPKHFQSASGHWHGGAPQTAADRSSPLHTIRATIRHNRSRSDPHVQIRSSTFRRFLLTYTRGSITNVTKPHKFGPLTRPGTLLGQGAT